MKKAKRIYILLFILCLLLLLWWRLARGHTIGSYTYIPAEWQNLANEVEYRAFLFLVFCGCYILGALAGGLLVFGLVKKDQLPFSLQLTVNSIMTVACLALSLYVVHERHDTAAELPILTGAFAVALLYTVLAEWKRRSALKKAVPKDAAPTTTETE